VPVRAHQRAARVAHSYLDFQRIFGDWDDLVFADNGDSPNFVALGVKGFFDEGGNSLYVSRLFNYTHPYDPSHDHAWAELPASLSPPLPPLTLRARFPGEAGQMKVALTLKVGRNALVSPGASANLTRVHEYDLVYAGSGSTANLYVVHRDLVRARATTIRAFGFLREPESDLSHAPAVGELRSRRIRERVQVRELGR